MKARTKKHRMLYNIIDTLIGTFAVPYAVIMVPMDDSSPVASSLLLVAEGCDVIVRDSHVECPTLSYTHTLSL